ncbi:MAG: DUF2974 domain-containing protein [Lachnospiraceae bacterium]|nr:DUF2974 domain-containing protein [Lachnospiraceae bacterium]
MSVVFSDKELQIAAQLAYFNFLEIANNEAGTMVERTLHDIFSENKDYIYLYDQIRHTRQFDIETHSGGAWDSREHATLDLMNFLADPLGYDECVNEDNNAVNWSEIAEWKIVDINDQNDENGFYAVTFEVPGKGMLVAFRGSESYDESDQTLFDWILADFGLLNSESTIEQDVVKDYMSYLSRKFEGSTWYTTGHSLGGNLAEHALITAPENMNVVKAVSFDGPGFSSEYLAYHMLEIHERIDKLEHYKWSTVGEMLYPIIDLFGLNILNLKCENYYHIQTTSYDDAFTLSPENVLSPHMHFITLNFDGLSFTSSPENLLSPSTNLFDINYDGINHNIDYILQRHAPCFVDFDDDGNVIPIKFPTDELSIINYCVHIISELVDLDVVILNPIINLNDIAKTNDESVLHFLDILLCIDRKLDIYEVLAGSSSDITLNCIGEELANNTLRNRNSTIIDQYKNASRAIVNRDPLAIDFGSEGIDLTTIDDGVYFDLDNNGFAEKTAWIGTKDGFLVLDRNANGSIDNGGELFGDQVWLSDGYISASGFDALKELDTNEDGIIDENDAAFSALKVWVDASHDGISQDGELKTLAELGIQSISLEVTQDQSLDDETGTLRSESAVVTYVDGTTTKISEFLFNVDTTDTVTGTGENRKNTIGNIPDIMDAIESDESGILGDLFNSFSEAINPVDKRAIFTKILYKITGAEDIDSSSRGANIDARNMHVVETFMGRSFMGVDGSEPNANAAIVLNELYRDIEDTCYLKLLMSTSFSDACNSIFEYTDGDGNKQLHLTLFNLLNIGSISDNQNIDTVLYDMSVFLKCYDDVNGTSYLSDYKEIYGGLSDHYKSILSTLDNGYTVLGETNDDYLRGTSGNDILFAGAGDDYINGGTGNDAYYFKLGDGHDTIIDAEYSDTEGRADKIVFGEGINADDIEADRYGNDLYINYSDDDGIVVKDAYNWYSSDGRNMVESIEFADGTVWDLDKINREAEIREGSDGNDVMNGYWAAAGCTGNETIHGRAGDDVIRAYDGDDTVYGDEGNDEIYGESGNDTIIGGTGNDYLEGGIGNDTYIFNLGDGRDTIIDAEYSYTEGRADKIVFGEGISADDIVVDRYGNDLYINYSDNDGFVVRDAYNWYSSDGRNLIESIEFADGTVWDLDKINREAEIREGSDGNDVMNGYWASAGCTGNETLHGRGGNDTIYASDGNDILYGDEGNDNLYGQEGDDTIIGGIGNDYLEGGNGNDTYIFNLGDGSDSIVDVEYSNTLGRADKIVFGEDISAEDIIVDREGDHLKIRYSDDDTITVQDAYYWYSRDGRNFVENIEFADGTIWDSDKINREAEVRKGSNNNDTMWGYGAASGYTGNETFYGRGGNDTIYASDGNDILYGDEGNDNLYGQEGNDTIIGGTGNDYLEGGNGNDTYIFNLGDGRDTINDFEFSETEGRADKIVFGEGISADDIIVNREGDHLKIRYSDDDSITVQDVYNYYHRDGRSQVELVEFKDDSLYRINYDSTTLDFVESLRTEPETVVNDVEEDENVVEIEFMVSAVEELMDESSVDDTIAEDIIVSESSIDTMVSLIIQDMSETPSENVGSSDDLFEESSSGEYGQLWVVNE